jgi:hypothetical protein
MINKDHCTSRLQSFDGSIQHWLQKLALLLHKTLGRKTQTLFQQWMVLCSLKFTCHHCWTFLTSWEIFQSIISPLELGPCNKCFFVSKVPHTISRKNTRYVYFEVFKFILLFPILISSFQDVSKIVFVAYFYSATNPALLFMSAIALVIRYYTDKYCLLVSYPFSSPTPLAVWGSKLSLTQFLIANLV